MRSLQIALSFACAGWVTAAVGQPIAGTFPLKWKAQTGCTSYRTEPAVVGTKVFLGSNGSHFNDYLVDSGNGVHVISGMTGKVERTLGEDAWGDVDVNGVLAVGDRVFFGNDNDEFLCYSAKDYRLIWRIPTSGDCEHVPTLIRRKGGDQVVVFATEIGEVRAVRPSDGSTVWVHYSEKFDGWKPGSPHFVYKVAAAMTSGTTYFDPPHVQDLTGDGVVDLVYYGEDHAVCLSGATGEVLLRHPVGNYFHYQRPTVVSTPEGPVLVQRDYHLAFDKTTLHRTLLPSGKALASTEVDGSCRLETYGSPRADVSGLLIRTRSEPHRFNVAAGTTVPLPVAGSNKNYYSHCFMGARTAKYKGKEVLVQIVETAHGKEYGLLELLDPSTLHLVASFDLPGRCESRPHLLDVDADGALELLFGCANGVFYCHEIPAK